jgi:hypothetical protein
LQTILNHYRRRPIIRISRLRSRTNYSIRVGTNNLIGAGIRYRNNIGYGYNIGTNAPYTISNSKLNKAFQNFDVRII